MAVQQELDPITETTGQPNVGGSDSGVGHLTDRSMTTAHLPGPPPSFSDKSIVKSKESKVKQKQEGITLLVHVGATSLANISLLTALPPPLSPDPEPS